MERSIRQREDGKLEISYPFNEWADKSRSNYNQAKAVQVSVERGLDKCGICQAYDEEIRKAVETEH